LRWRKLPTEPYPGKQDDVFFTTAATGWYGNGAGKVYRTNDGGASWTKVWEKPGTFVRCLAFVDERMGVLGNIGPGYFRGVSDEVPIYRTVDGGMTWVPATSIEGAPVAGVCAFDVIPVPFINAGVSDRRPRIVGVGRVGGPAALVWSDDLGATWKRGTLPPEAAMAFDVKFLDDSRGFVAAATDADVSRSRAAVPHDSRPRASTGSAVSVSPSCHQTTSWRLTQGQTWLGITVTRSPTRGLVAQRDTST
jgi:hypothetical protein